MRDLDLNLMRRSGRILAEVLHFLENEYVSPGISTWDISNKAEEIIRDKGGTPAFLGYGGFPAAACVSVNNQAVHTIPNKNSILSPGDIVSIDCGVIIEGHYSDACRTIAVEKISSRASKLLKTTKKSLDVGISYAIPGNKVGDISYNIQRQVERKGFNINRNYIGHGIGLNLHQPPQVPNHGPPGRGPLLVEGTCLAIEPVVFDGPTETVLREDGWTIESKYGNICAHFEDTVMITKNGPEILTRL